LPPAWDIAHAPTGRGAHDSPAVQEAVALLMDAVYEFCACVSPCGVPLFTRLDGQVGGVSARQAVASLRMG